MSLEFVAGFILLRIFCRRLRGVGGLGFPREKEDTVLDLLRVHERRFPVDLFFWGTMRTLARGLTCFAFARLPVDLFFLGVDRRVSFDISPHESFRYRPELLMADATDAPPMLWEDPWFIVPTT
jgi:hypothetical protein